MDSTGSTDSTDEIKKAYALIHWKSNCVDCFISNQYCEECEQKVKNKVSSLMSENLEMTHLDALNFIVNNGYQDV